MISSSGIIIKLIQFIHFIFNKHNFCKYQWIYYLSLVALLLYVLEKIYKYVINRKACKKDSD